MATMLVSVENKRGKGNQNQRGTYCRLTLLEMSQRYFLSECEHKSKEGLILLNERDVIPGLKQHVNN